MYIFTLKESSGAIQPDTRLNTLFLRYMHAIRGSNKFLSSKIHQEMSLQALGLFILLFLVVKAIWEGLKNDLNL